MSTKRYREIKDLTQEELVTRIRETENSLFQARMQHRMGTLENTGSLKNFRKDIARFKMLLSQKKVQG